MNLIEQLRGERDQARSAALAMTESDSFDPTDKVFLDLEKRTGELDARISKMSGLLEAQASAASLDSKLSTQLRSKEQADESRKTDGGSWGELFTRSDVFAEYGGRGTSARVEVTEKRALPHSLAGFDDLLQAKNIVQDISDPKMPNVILPLVNNIPVSQNSVDFVKWTKAAGGAAVAPEGSDKVSAEWAATITSDTLDTIAVWTQLTRQLIEDSSAVQSYIDGELRYEVGKAEEAAAKAAVVAATLPTAEGPAGEGMIGAVRAGMAAVEAAGYNPTAFLVNSDDLVAMDIAAMKVGATSPDRRGTYWGLTPIVDPGASAGTVTVGDFRAGVTRFVRKGVSLYVTDSHAETFTANIFTLLAESRQLTVVTRPAALVEATEDSGRAVRGDAMATEYPTIDDVKAWLRLDVTDEIDDSAIEIAMSSSGAAQSVSLELGELGVDELPDDVVQAWYLRVQRYLARRNSPDGLIGFGDFTPAQITRLDPDIATLEGPYRKMVIA